MEYYIYKSPIGKLLITTEDETLIRIDYYDQVDKMSGIKERSTPITVALDRYFDGEDIDFLELDIKVTGTDYQKAVYKELINVGCGDLITYKDLSEKLVNKGIKSSPQSIGGAVGKNPISIFIPCHRVVGTNKKLTGFRGGLDRKAYLLELEGHKVENGFLV